MSMHRDDHEALKAKLFQLETDNHQLEIEKTQLQEIFKDQIEDLDTNLKKVL
jgi:regulator of replication initiation timing